MKQTEKELIIRWSEFLSPDDLAPAERELLATATQALDHAYAPYSRFRVGAAIRLENELVLSGANQENAAYPMCLCAERVALAAAAAQYPGLAITHMAISVRNERRLIDRPGAPCGACRQVMVETEERYGRDFSVILRGETGPIVRIATAKDLLPLHFDQTFL